MEIANNYQEICVQTGKWFMQAFDEYNKLGLMKPRTKYSLYADIVDEFDVLIAWSIKARYAQFPYDHAENWLTDNASFKMGALVFIMDIVYLESADSVISDEMGTIYDIQDKTPTVFEALIGSSMFQVVAFLRRCKLSEEIIFGDMSFDDDFREKDDSDAIAFIASKYVARWK